MLTTAAAIETFLATLRSAQTPINTIKAYRLDLLRFARAAPEDLAAVTIAQIHETDPRGDSHHRHARSRPVHRAL